MEQSVDALPDLFSIRCFLEAARRLNFRSAARAVALSPAAYGQRIRQLEGELGVRLFQRTTRSVTLTEDGHELLPHAQRALDAAHACCEAAAGRRSVVPVEITLGTRHELGLSWIVPRLRTLERTRRGLTVHLYFGSGADLVARVRDQAIDCAVTSTRLSDPKLDAIPLHEEEYVFVAAASLLRERPLRSARDARQHTLLDATEELPLFSYWRDAPGAFDGQAFRGVVRLGTIAAIREVLLDRGGVAVLPRYFVERDLRARRLTQVLPRVSARSDRFRLVHRREDARRALFAALAAELMAAPLR